MSSYMVIQDYTVIRDIRVLFEEKKGGERNRLCTAGKLLRHPVGEANKLYAFQRREGPENQDTVECKYDFEIQLGPQLWE